MKRLLLITTLCSFIPALSAADAIAPDKTIVLFNGKNLDGWKMFSKDNDHVAAGTWGVANGVITNGGMPYGYLYTEKTYRDYKLTLEWRWIPDHVHRDKDGKPRPRNSGVLLHIHGTHKVWPDCVEAQLMEANAGDFWILGKATTAELIAHRERLVAAAKTDAERKRMALARNLRRKNTSAPEKPLGEWNHYEIICHGDTVILTVNGLEQNRATKSSTSAGHIGLQSEGGKMEFRNIKLEPLPKE